MRRLRIGRLEPETAGRLDRAEKQLQHMKRAAGLEAVRMRRDPAHRVHRDGPPDHPLVTLALPVGPGLFDHDFFLKGRRRQIGGKLADPCSRNPDLWGHRFRRIFIGEIGFGHQHEGRHRGAATLHLHLAVKRDAHLRVGVWRRLAAVAVKHHRRAVTITKEQAVIRPAGVADHKPWRVGVAAEIVDIDLAGTHQFAHQRENQKPVGARRNAIPIIGNGRIAGLHRVHRDYPCAACFQLAKPYLDRVRIMVLSNPEQHEKLGQIPIRRAELPECAAEGVDTAGRHIDRTEAAMRRKVRGAELLCPPSCQGLRLVTAGEEGQLLRVGFADRGKPVGGDAKRLVPADFLELAGTARPDPLHRGTKARRRIMLHDTGRSLGTENALVHRMVAVALDVTDLAVTKMNIYAAAAGAHVAGRLPDLVTDMGGGVDLRLNGHVWSS